MTDPTPATAQDPKEATIAAMAGALAVRDQCIAGQAVMILQLQTELEALRRALTGAAQPKEA